MREDTSRTESADPLVPPWGALLVAVLAIGWAGPLVRLATAPALAVAAWRLIFTMGFLALVVGWRRTVLGGARLRPREWLLGVLSGILLAGHFWAWFAAVRYTSIADAVVLVTTYPFWIAALSMLFLGERPSSREWIGIAIAVGGTAIIAWGDFRPEGPAEAAAGMTGGSGGSLVGGAVRGDLLALGAAVLVAGYFTIGRGLRRRLDLWAYVNIVYGAAAAVLTLAVLVTPRVPFTGYPPGDWLVFLGLAAGPMMIGHTGINYAIRYMPAYVANLAILAEAIVAAVIAWLLPAIAEVPSGSTLIGGCLVLAGIGVGTLGRSGSPPAPAEATRSDGAP